MNEYRIIIFFFTTVYQHKNDDSPLWPASALVQYPCLSFKSSLISLCFPTKFLCAFTLHDSVCSWMFPECILHGNLPLQGHILHPWQREKRLALLRDCSHWLVYRLRCCVMPSPNFLMCSGLSIQRALFILKRTREWWRKCWPLWTPMLQIQFFKLLILN